MNHVAIRDAIVAALEDIDGVENVYTKEPRFEDDQDVEDHARERDEAQTSYWVVRRKNSMPFTSDNSSEVSNCFVHWHHTFEIQYKHAYIEDNSEEVFQERIDDVLSAFQDNRTLSNLVFGNQTPLALMDIRPDWIGNVYADLAVFQVTFVDIVASDPA